ncbi:MAG: GNAT family protein [Ginsengibacter sp.]
MHITYRSLLTNDADIYREIRLDCLRNFPDNFGTLFENEVNSKALKFNSVLKQENSKSFLCGAFHKNKLIGICGFSREEKPKIAHRGNISQMYLLTAYAGLGIAKQIVKATLEKAFADITLEIIGLGVVSDNYKAIKLYIHFGFKQFGNFENYFKQGDHYWSLDLMTLSRKAYFNKIAK